MNERVRIRLVQKNAQVGTNFLSDEGILLNNEADSWPRGFALRFGGDDDITRHLMHRISVVEGWESDRFRLRLSTSQGDLLVTGVKHDTFPAGRYWLEVQVADLAVHLLMLGQGHGTEVPAPVSRPPSALFPMSRQTRKGIVSRKEQSV